MAGFILMPRRLINWPGITPAAFKLYFWYRIVCKENPEGVCGDSLARIAEILDMHKNTILSARKILEEIRLISINRSRTETGTEQVSVMCLNVDN